MNATPAVKPTPPLHPAATVFHMEMDGQPLEVTLIHPDDLPSTLSKKGIGPGQTVSGCAVTLDSPLGVWLRGCQVGSEESLTLQPRLGTVKRVKVTGIYPATAQAAPLTSQAISAA